MTERQDLLSAIRSIKAGERLYQDGTYTRAATCARAAIRKAAQYSSARAHIVLEQATNLEKHANQMAEHRRNIFAGKPC